MGNGNSRSSPDAPIQSSTSANSSSSEPTTGIESYSLFNHPRLLKDATFVNTLRLHTPEGEDSRWPLRNFVEIWKLCANRSDEFYEEKTAKTKTNENENERQQQKNIRRDGQIVFKHFPFPVVVRISRFLEHLPVIRLPEILKFSCAGTFLMNAPSLIGVDKVLTIVEDMKFDMKCVVSFCVRLACDGKVIKDSRFFINPDMTIGIWIPKYHCGGLNGEDSNQRQKAKNSGLMWREQKSKLVKFRLFPRDADEENMLEEALFFDRVSLRDRPINKNNEPSCLFPTDGSVILMDPNFSQMKGFLKDQYFMHGTRDN